MKRNILLRYFLGDIRNLDRLKNAVKNVDYIVHTVGNKSQQQNTIRRIYRNKYNWNLRVVLMFTCLESSVSKIIALSADMTVPPANLYGATKLCADKLIIAANHIKGNKKISFSIVKIWKCIW